MALEHLRSTMRLKSLKEDLVAVSQDVTGPHSIPAFPSRRRD